MIADTVESEAEFNKRLESYGLEKTTERTSTGALWKHKASGKHVIVPDAYQGYYPRWLTADLWEIIRALPRLN